MRRSGLGLCMCVKACSETVGLRSGSRNGFDVNRRSTRVGTDRVVIDDDALEPSQNMSISTITPFRRIFATYIPPSSASQEPGKR